MESMSAEERRARIAANPRPLLSSALPAVPNPIPFTACLKQLGLGNLDAATIKRVAYESNRLYSAHYNRAPQQRSTIYGPAAKHEVEVVRMVCTHLKLLNGHP